MEKLLVQCLLAFLAFGFTFAATPTNCSYFPYCGIGGQCIEDAVPPNTKCICYQGFQLSQVTFECEDIDECNVTTAAVCPYGRCQNLVGTYKCHCPPGYAPHYPDGKTCERIQVSNQGGIFGNLNLWQLLLLLRGEL